MGKIHNRYKAPKLTRVKVPTAFVQTIPCSKCSDTRRYAKNNICPTCSCRTARAWQTSPKGRAKVRAYQKTEKYKRMGRRRDGIPEPLTKNPGACECCGTTKPTGPGGTLHVDHNHTNGRFRGWLCHDCNTGIGKLGDTIAGLLRAIEYMKRGLLMEELV